MTRRGQSRWLSATLGTALGAVALALIPVPAHAANYDIGGKVPGYSGYGYSNGEIAFYSNIKRFSWIGQVRDACDGSGNGDGKGMEVRIRIQYRNGTYGWENNVIEDLNGCGPDYVYVNFPVSYYENLNIAAVQVQLWATEGGTPFVAVDSSTWKTNPN